MLAVLVESRAEDEGSSFAASLAEVLTDGIIGRVSVIGPTAATIRKLKDVYRHMLYVKSIDTDILTTVKDRAEAYCENNLKKDVRVSFDLDPMNGY